MDIYKKLLDDEWNQRIQDEARIANEIQSENTEISRTEALKAAKRIIDQNRRRTDSQR